MRSIQIRARDRFLALAHDDVHFDWNLQTPILGQVADSEFQICFDSEHAKLFLCLVFTKRPMNVRKMSQMMSTALVCAVLLKKSIATLREKTFVVNA